MATTVEGRSTPIHLWIVGILSLLWSCFGCVDYVMTRTRNIGYLKASMPSVDPNTTLAYVDGFPLWASIGWGLGVWFGLIGSVLLIMRSRHAVLAMGISFVGAILGLGYQIAKPMPGMTGFMVTGMPVVIILIALALFLYARAMDKRGVLR